MRNFTRTIEDFVCEHCGEQVKGTGYTNHCPKCLWSRHVDINPGDRLADCGGMMEPIAVRMSSDGYTLTHKCQKCGYKKNNKTDPKDNFEEILALAKRIAP